MSWDATKRWFTNFFYLPEFGRYQEWTQNQRAGFDQLMLQSGIGIAILLWSTALLLVNDHFERLAVGWFWGFFVTAFIGDSFPYTTRLRYNRRLIFAVMWPLTTVIIGAVFWDQLYYVDRITHTIREGIGENLGLGRLFGAEHAHDAFCLLLFGGVGTIVLLRSFLTEDRKDLWQTFRYGKPKRFQDS